MSYYYFSFVDPHRPKGDRFLGGCYVRVPADEDLDDPNTLMLTLRQSHRLGINPGGEVAATGPLPDEIVEATVLPKDRHRLLSREEIEDNDRRVREESMKLNDL